MLCSKAEVTWKGVTFFGSSYAQIAIVSERTDGPPSALPQAFVKLSETGMSDACHSGKLCAMHPGPQSESRFDRADLPASCLIAISMLASLL